MCVTPTLIHRSVAAGTARFRVVSTSPETRVVEPNLRRPPTAAVGGPPVLLLNSVPEHRPSLSRRKRGEENARRARHGGRAPAGRPCAPESICPFRAG